VLRAEQPPWPTEADPAALLRQADEHGVIPLVHAQMAKSAWPAELLDELRKRSVGQAMWELRHQQLLAQALLALSAGGVQPIIIKGTALAHWLYSNPVLRARGDTDLLVPEGARQLAHEILDRSGFHRQLAIEGESISYQASYGRTAKDGTSHTLDLHWKINNSEVLSRLFTYEELQREAIRLPDLAEHALGTSLRHSLLIACMHRATHRTNPYYVAGEQLKTPDRLIWLWDIHLLAQRMDVSDWPALAALANRKGMRQVVQEGLLHSAHAFGTRLPEELPHSLTDMRADQAASRYLAAGAVRQWAMDWMAIPNWPARWRWLLETAFPSPAYMRRHYENTKPQWLPWLYFRRAVLGIFKRLSSTTGRPS